MTTHADRITLDTIEKLQFLHHQIDGLLTRWADAVAHEHPLFVTDDDPLRDHAQQVLRIAAGALDAYLTVFPESSPHADFAYVRPFSGNATVTVVDRGADDREQAELAREVAEEVLGLRWVPQNPNDPASGPGFLGDSNSYPFDGFLPAASFCPAAEGPDGSAAAARVIDAMAGHGFWHQTKGPFSPEAGALSWAGFTPHGVTGWNGCPDHWTGTPNLNQSISLAALAAVRHLRQAHDEDAGDTPFNSPHRSI